MYAAQSAVLIVVILTTVRLSLRPSASLCLWNVAAEARDSCCQAISHKRRRYCCRCTTRHQNHRS